MRILNSDKNSAHRAWRLLISKSDIKTLRCPRILSLPMRNASQVSKAGSKTNARFAYLRFLARVMRIITLKKTYFHRYKGFTMPDSFSMGSTSRSSKSRQLITGILDSRLTFPPISLLLHIIYRALNAFPTSHNAFPLFCPPRRTIHSLKLLTNSQVLFLLSLVTIHFWASRRSLCSRKNCNQNVSSIKGRLCMISAA